MPLTCSPIRPKSSGRRPTANRLQIGRVGKSRRELLALASSHLRSRREEASARSPRRDCPNRPICRRFAVGLLPEDFGRIGEQVRGIEAKRPCYLTLCL